MNRFIIYIIFILSILSLLIILNNKKDNKLKSENYIPEIGDDVWRYLILPGLSLKELKNFAMTNRENLKVVNKYLSDFKAPTGLNLTVLNKAYYFVPYPTTKKDVMREELEPYYNTQRDLERQVDLDYAINTMPRMISMYMLYDFFQILGKRGWNMKISLPQTEIYEEKIIKIFSLDDLKLENILVENINNTNKDSSFKVKNSFNKEKLQGYDFAIQFIKNDILDYGTIKIFIRKETNDDLIKKMDDLKKHIDLLLSNLTGRVKINKNYLTDENNNEYGTSYTIELENVSMKFPEEGYDTIFKEYVPRKKGNMSLDIDEIKE